MREFRNSSREEVHAGDKRKNETSIQQIQKNEIIFGARRDEAGTFVVCDNCGIKKQLLF